MILCKYLGLFHYANALYAMNIYMSINTQFVNFELNILCCIHTNVTMGTPYAVINEVFFVCSYEEVRHTHVSPHIFITKEIFSLKSTFLRP